MSSEEAWSQRTAWTVSVGSFAVSSAWEVNAETVIGHCGDLADTESDGAVNGRSNIDKYEAMAGRYTGFLSPAAKADAYGVFRSNMSGNRAGASGSDPYTATSDRTHRPINFISLGDRWITSVPAVSQLKSSFLKAERSPTCRRNTSG